MGKVIGRIYKYDQRNYPYPSPNTTFVITPSFYTYIQTQCSSDYVAYAGANYESLAGLYRSTNHNINTDVSDNNNSQSFEKPSKKNCQYSSFGYTISTTTTP